MTTDEQLPGSVADGVVEDGETYDHAEHGRVEVTGIWHRAQRIDTTRDTDEQAMVVVRFLPARDGVWIDECAESLDDFLEATD